MQQPDTRHIQSLDGLRGLAILMVMASHFWAGARPVNFGESALYTTIQNGSVGVDLFFVLSGFLITGILLDAKGTDGYFRNFYARRFLRIFPVYYGFLFLFFVIAPRVIDAAAAGPYAESRESAVWFWTYTSNFLSLVKGAKVPPGLNHFWTLAVEEQFYLAWPAVVFLTSRSALKKVCIGLVIGALAFRVGLRFTDYYFSGGSILTFARIDTLAIGAWLAAVVRGHRGKVSVDNWAPYVLAAAVASLIVLNLPGEQLRGSDLRMQTVGFPLLSAVSASVIVLCTSARREQSWIRRVFDSRSLGFFGKYSYGMYVFHLPLSIALSRMGLEIGSFPRVHGSDLPGAFVYALIAAALTTAIAYLSWHLYERQFLKLKKYFPRASIDKGLAELAEDENPPREDREVNSKPVGLEPLVFEAGERRTIPDAL